jgi:hypothetical protein
VFVEEAGESIVGGAIGGTALSCCLGPASGDSGFAGGDGLGGVCRFAAISLPTGGTPAPFHRTGT